MVLWDCKVLFLLRFCIWVCVIILHQGSSWCIYLHLSLKYIFQLSVFYYFILTFHYLMYSYSRSSLAVRYDYLFPITRGLNICWLFCHCFNFGSWIKMFLSLIVLHYFCSIWNIVPWLWVHVCFHPMTSGDFTILEFILALDEISLFVISWVTSCHIYHISSLVFVLLTSWKLMFSFVWYFMYIWFCWHNRYSCVTATRLWFLPYFTLYIFFSSCVLLFFLDCLLGYNLKVKSLCSASLAWLLPRPCWIRIFFCLTFTFS